ncbi:MAG: cbb3-type cytochrome c oxidase subunit 3 [Reyranella sp.]|uniref:cbb3-type cytochrome oxidase subunit 3 n=1 Tax=Reyranella sp. TaxID=1929291 RepID=UPI001ACDD967|nr:cbb3-type cytochrome c oxidase subunit 3 [Reyranella sp.]MBN9536432.1 cbb3-type cytochrome c oxidase subunit 3 [Alphaproteobacteria bacterium]MBR2818654.1 cbb3-type cytochrome c oxidase subunit 3 [Reyranella sp.]
MNLQMLGELLSSIWTIWAIVVFAGIAFWAWRPKNRRRFEKDSRIPLNDDC